MKEKRCLRCGQCCVLSDLKVCDYLIVYLSGATRCLIYPHRIGALLRTGQYCTQRKNIDKKFEGCPYND